MLRFCCSSASLCPLQTLTNLHCPPLPLSTYSVVTYSKHHFSARQFGNKIVHNHTPCGRDRHAVNAAVIASCEMQKYCSYTIKYEDCFSILYVIGASVSELSLNLVHVDSTDALSCTIYTAGTRYCACAALRANVAGRIGNRVSPAESAFSACIGSGSSQTS